MQLVQLLVVFAGGTSLGCEIHNQDYFPSVLFHGDVSSVDICSCEAVNVVWGSFSHDASWLLGVGAGLFSEPNQ